MTTLERLWQRRTTNPSPGLGVLFQPELPPAFYDLAPRTQRQVHQARQKAARHLLGLVPTPLPRWLRVATEHSPELHQWVLTYH